jgi:hypothetical protein
MFATPAIIPYKLFDRRGPNAISCDFRNHRDIEDWEPIVSTTIALEAAGEASSKCLRVETTLGAALTGRVMWLNSRLDADDDQEALALVSYHGVKATTSTSINAGVFIKGLGSPINVVGTGVGRNTTTDSRVRTNALNGSSQFGAVNFGWTIGNLYWCRIRARPTRSLQSKVWAFGDPEPGSFTTFAAASGSWPNVPGYAGFLYARGSTAAGQFMRCHYISVGYDDADAPFP